MDPSEHMILTPPMRLEPWIRHFDPRTERDERQASAVRLIKAREAAQLAAIPTQKCEQCETDRPFLPSTGMLSGMSQFAGIPKKGPLDPDYFSARSNGELPILMKLARESD